MTPDELLLAFHAAHPGITARAFARGTIEDGRSSYQLLADAPHAADRVLDLGCGDGTLLRHLWQTRQAPGYGVEIDDAQVLECIRNDVNVLQMDLEDGLSAFQDRSFDYVILSETLQTIRRQEAAA